MTREATAAPGGVRALRNHDDTVVWSDGQLLSQFLSRSGESAEAAFTTLIERHGPLVHRVCLDILRGRDEAQDAAQAVFLVLARKAGSIRKPESLGPWLHGVALRVARHARSEMARRRVAERRNAEMSRQRQATESGLETMDYTELHEEIDRLPEKYRRPIILCYMKGYTHSQAAELLGWPMGTVQVRLHRGRERLRSGLTRRGFGLIGLTLAGLETSLSATPDVPGREWTETTARAAIRFASGQGTSGLVAPVVIGWAEWALTAVFRTMLKIVALTTIALVLGWVGFSAIGPSNDGTVSIPGATRTTGHRIDPVPTPQAALREARVHKDDRAAIRPVPVGEKSDGPLTPIVPLPEPTVDHEVVSRSPSSPGQTLSLAMVDRRSEKAPSEGRELFERIWVKDDRRSHGGDGLGPVFNGQSCVVCHNRGGSGGAGGIEQNIEIATVSDDIIMGQGYSYAFSMDFGTGRFTYRMGGAPQASSRGDIRADARSLAAIHPGFKESRSVVLHRYGTDPAYQMWRESVAGRHGSMAVRISLRNPPPLFGMGLIDAIPDEAIEAAAKRRFPGSAQIKGRVSRLKDGRIGRFGWKAQTATLEEFVYSAAAGEVGLEIPARHQGTDPRLPGLAATGLDMDQRECEALVEHVRSLPAPVAIRPATEKESAQIKAGEAAFKSIGCTGCHLPKLGDVEGIYSDLLLHDMGPQPGDADAYTVFVESSRGDGPAVADRNGSETGAASAREWRTPPLWGLRDSGPYMHDGRASRIDQAIASHAGQGASASKRYAELSPQRKRQIEAFLMSLAASTRMQ